MKIINWKEIKNFCIQKDPNLIIFDFEILEYEWILRFANKDKLEKDNVIMQYKSNIIIYNSLKKWFLTIKLNENFKENINDIGKVITEFENTNKAGSSTKTDPSNITDEIYSNSAIAESDGKNFGNSKTFDNSKIVDILEKINEFIKKNDIYNKIVDTLSPLYKTFYFDGDDIIWKKNCGSCGNCEKCISLENYYNISEINIKLEKLKKQIIDENDFITDILIENETEEDGAVILKKVIIKNE